MFFAIQKTDVHDFHFFVEEKVLLDLNCTKSLLYSF